MQKKVNGNITEYIMEGPISEKTEIFDQQIPNALGSEIKVNMDKVTFINSIGVKNWINWTMKIPRTVKFTLEKCPYVIINQVNMVHGFVPEHATIESFVAPFICNSCQFEKPLMATLGKEYSYAAPGVERQINLPEDMACPKCKAIMEPDFFEEKIFGFLTKRKI